MSRGREVVVGSLGSLALITTVLLGVSWYVAGDLVQSPLSERRGRYADREARRLERLKLDAEEFLLPSFDGTSLSGLYFPSRNGAAVIVQHGYRGARSEVLGAVEILQRHGFGAVAFDLRGHGASGGEWITLGRDDVEDLLRVFEYLKAKPGVEEHRIGMLGFSLGGSLAIAHAAANPELRAIVADSPYDVINRVTVAEFTDLPPPIPSLVTIFMAWRLGVDFATLSPLALVAEISPRPVFILVAGSDTVVDAGSGERLYAAAGEPRKIWLEPDYDHCTFFYKNPQRFEDEVVGFFKQHLTETPIGR
jgi:fermentation-respiration switch protein FrsA (DUF1100 family)